ASNHSLIAEFHAWVKSTASLKGALAAALALLSDPRHVGSGLGFRRRPVPSPRALNIIKASGLRPTGLTPSALRRCVRTVEDSCRLERSWPLIEHSMSEKRPTRPLPGRLKSEPAIAA